MQSNTPIEKSLSDYEHITITKWHLKTVYSYFMWLMKQNQSRKDVHGTKIPFEQIFNPNGNQIRAFSEKTFEQYGDVVLALYHFVGNFNKISGLAVNFEPVEYEHEVVPLLHERDLIVSNPTLEILSMFYKYSLYLLIEPRGDMSSREILLDQLYSVIKSDFCEKARIPLFKLEELRFHVVKDINNLFISTNIQGA